MSNPNYTMTQVENFLEGKMNPLEAASFEKAMVADPALRLETDLQRQIMEAIRESRRLELKARLDAVKVPATWHTPTYMAALIGGAIVVGIGLSIYLLSTDPSEKTAQLHQPEAIEQPAPSPELQAEEPSYAEADQTEANAAKDSDVATSVEISPKKDGPAQRPMNKPNAVPPTVPSDADDLDLEDGGMPEAHGTDRAKVTSTIGMPEVRVVNDGKQAFAYSLTNNKLALFGDFAADTYQILELNSKKGRKIYLKYQQGYYGLTPTLGKTMPLTKVDDMAVLEKLKGLSKH